MSKFLPFQYIVNNYDVLLFDLWGVIIKGENTYPGVVEIINKLSLNKRVYFVTNSSRPARILAQILINYGIQTKAEYVITSGDRALNIIGPKYKKIFHLGLNTADQILADHLHLVCDDITQADLLLLSLYKEEGDDLSEYDEVFKRSIALRIPVVCANPDYVNVNDGKLRYLPGYFAKILSDQGAEVTYTGKPHKVIYNHVLETLGKVKQEKILMIGDTLETDIFGAQQAGIDSALVISGNSTKFYKNTDNLDEICKKLQTQSEKVNIFPTYITDIK